MLVLSRRIHESIQVSDSIVVQVLGIKGRQVKLGVTAPDDVRILRVELNSLQPLGASDVDGLLGD